MTVFTGGTFDLFHSGHVNFLKQCHKLAAGDTVAVSLNTDNFVFEYKGKFPVMSYEEREAVLRSCRWVNKVIPNTGGADSKKTIERYIKEYFGWIDIVVVGSDWHEKDYLAQMGFTWDWLREKNIALCYVPYTPNISTTLIKERL